MTRTGRAWERNPNDTHRANCAGITAWEARAEADMVARPLPDLPAWDERAHLASLATSIAPGPPLNLRRRRKNLLTRLMDAIIAALP